MPDPEHVCLPLICPEMLDLTLSLLPKPWHLKASTEGAYRFLFDSYALLCFGVNVKNWSLRKDISMFSSRSSFAPLAFAYLASKENDEADTHLGRALIATARTSSMISRQRVFCSGAGICALASKRRGNPWPQVQRDCRTGRM